MNDDRCVATGCVATCLFHRSTGNPTLSVLSIGVLGIAVNATWVRPTTAYTSLDQSAIQIAQ
jgi:hypothetical protein